jgi:hypothetical protein
LRATYNNAGRVDQTWHAAGLHRNQQRSVEADAGALIDAQQREWQTAPMKLGSVVWRVVFIVTALALLAVP